MKQHEFEDIDTDTGTKNDNTDDTEISDDTDDSAPKMPLPEHLAELHARARTAVITFLVCLLPAAFFADPIITRIIHAASGYGIELVTQSPTEHLTVYMRFLVLLAAVLAAPVFMYQAWGFIRPGLYSEERQTAGIAFFFSVILLAMAVFLAIKWILPFLIQHGLQQPDTRAAWVLKSYMYFIFRVFLLTIFVCQIPMIAMILKNRDIPLKTLFIMVPLVLTLLFEDIFAIIILILFLGFILMMVFSLLQFSNALFLLDTLKSLFPKDADLSDHEPEDSENRDIDENISPVTDGEPSEADGPTAVDAAFKA